VGPVAPSAIVGGLAMAVSDRKGRVTGAAGHPTYCRLRHEAVRGDYPGIPERRGHHRITIDPAAEPLSGYHRAIPDQPRCISPNLPANIGFCRRECTGQERRARRKIRIRARKTEVVMLESSHIVAQPVPLEARADALFWRIPEPSQDYRD
jgi:hypothetical protein